MKISIVTPSFNSANYLSDCLESGIIQVEGGSLDVEHLVVDGGSTDGTVELLEQWSGSSKSKASGSRYSFKYISEPDQGMSDAINKGAKMASGDWWMWLNSDDYLLPNALKRVADLVNSHDKVDVIYGGWNFVDKEGKHLKTMRLFPFDLNMMIHYGCYIGSTSCFFKKSTTIDKGEFLNERFKQVMDQEYYARLGRKKLCFKYIPEILAEFRLHGENTSQRFTNKTDINAVLMRQIQLAEGATVRRVYGITLFENPYANAVVDSVLWLYYRVKKVFCKIRRNSYQ